MRDKLGRFVKGFNNKIGFKHSKESKEKMRKAHLGRKLSEETKEKLKGRIPWNKGLTKETDIRIKKQAKDISRILKGKEGNFKNKKHTTETREKISNSKKGQKSWNYIDGRSKNCSPARYGDDWFKIRMLIYRRDNFTCQECTLKMSKETGAFHVHHLQPFLESFDNSLSNLITLCPSCHRKIEAKIIKQLKMEV